MTEWPLGLERKLTYIDQLLMQVHKRPRAINFLRIHPKDRGDESEWQKKYCDHGEGHN
jgi:hypothetical protein